VPFIILTPGMRGGGRKIDQPVDLTAIYPTVAALCGLPVHQEADGVNLSPLLKGGQMELPPALMTYRSGNHALRTSRWRYIRYADGTEELYDHQQDPHEQHNLAGQSSREAVLKSFRSQLPGTNASPVPEQ
jgi:arylsulfatase A-like enzyme